jgi:hypothetical protein
VWAWCRFRKLMLLPLGAVHIYSSRKVRGGSRVRAVQSGHGWTLLSLGRGAHSEFTDNSRMLLCGRSAQSWFLGE